MTAPSQLRQTHTVVTLGLSQPAFDEIRAKLRAAGYDHVFMPDGEMDMTGLAVALDPDAEPRGTVTIDSKIPGFVKPDTDTQVFFYEQDFYVLSNFSAFRLNWAGLDFDTSEAAYHWAKFHHHPGIQEQIRVARSAHEAFKIAERARGFRRPDWDDVKLGLMKDILESKALQHEYVLRKLLATGDRELIEDSWRDDFWGWGPKRDGQNMLGKLWMEVRAELRAAHGAKEDGRA